MALASAFEGDFDAFDKYRELALATKPSELILEQRASLYLAIAQALSGDIDGSWGRIEPVLANRRLLSPWELKYDGLYPRLFGEHAPYQALIARLEAQQ